MEGTKNGRMVDKRIEDNWTFSKRTKEWMTGKQRTEEWKGQRTEDMWTERFKGSRM